MNDDTPYCLNDHTHGPAIGERINGMAGEHEVVDLYCAACLERNHP